MKILMLLSTFKEKHQNHGTGYFVSEDPIFKVLKDAWKSYLLWFIYKKLEDSVEVWYILKKSVHRFLQYHGFIFQM